MTGSWGTAQDLELLQWAEYYRRDLGDNFTIEMYGRRFEVKAYGPSVAVYERDEQGRKRIRAHRSEDD